MRSRHDGLSTEAARLLRDAGAHLERGDAASAERVLQGALALAPAHPEVLRLHAVACTLAGRPAEAADALRRALAKWPDDALLHNNIGSALRAAGDAEGAFAEFRRACELAPDLAAAWYNLGKSLKVLSRNAEAEDALRRALALAPAHVQARIVRGDNLKALGRIKEAVDEYRAALRRNEGAVQAWWGLANLKTSRFDHGDVLRLERQYASLGADHPSRALLGFALAKALEDDDRHAEAWLRLEEANAARRVQQPWDATAFSAEIDATLEAFESAPASDGDTQRGRGVVFIVSLPRSGSTLVEQIIAAHPDVDGAGELPDLPRVIEEESRRRGARFPQWAAQADADDWKRLGQRYLEHTSRWRTDGRHFTDKSLLTWPLVGAAVAMLPGARFVHCRRDPLETALSCFRQWFNNGQAFSYSIDDIAAYLHDHQRLMQRWVRLFPDRILELAHEELLADPEASVRRLMSFCRLPYDSACLEFHRDQRTVRTASAAQVREPLRRDTRRANRYGEALTPLRDALIRLSIR